jgi:hypothetical protein
LQQKNGDEVFHLLSGSILRHKVSRG